MGSTAVALVHHVRKNGAAVPGQALRGSGDFWAWGDSNLYLARNRGHLTLTVEHRSAPAPPPLSLRLDGADDPHDAHHQSTRLQICSADAPAADSTPLPDRVLAHLRRHGPAPHRTLRAALRVRDQTLSDALRSLHASGSIARTEHGWNSTSSA